MILNIRPLGDRILAEAVEAKEGEQGEIVIMKRLAGMREGLETPVLSLVGGSTGAVARKFMMNSSQPLCLKPEFMKYAIRWKSSVTGTLGTGTKRFEKEEAERLVKELNNDYPEIKHEAVIPTPDAAEPAVELVTPNA